MRSQYPTPGVGAIGRQGEGSDEEDRCNGYTECTMPQRERDFRTFPNTPFKSKLSCTVSGDIPVNFAQYRLNKT